MVTDISVNEASTVLREAVRDTIRRRSLWYLVQGGALMLAGLAALASPLLAFLGVVAIFGWLLLIAGVIEGAGLIGATKAPYFHLQAISAVLAIVVGWLFLAHPGVGALGIGLLMVVFLMVQGIQRVVFGLMIRPMADWGWVTASGALGLGLGVVLAAGLPDTAGWLLGILLGLHLIAIGAALALLAWRLRRAAS